MTSRSRKPLIMAALLLAAFAVNLDTTIVNVALPTLVRQLHASTEQLQWIVDAFNLLFAGSVLVAGSLSDRFGRKGMLMSGLAVFGLASLVGGLTDSSGALIAARAVMGIGAAMAFPATLSLLTHTFTERAERVLAIGLWGASTGVAVALGPIVGGALLQISDWRSIFFVMTPVALVAIGLVALAVPPSQDPRAPRIDGVGFVLSTLAVSLLVFTIIEAPTHGWASGRSLGSFAGVLVLGVAFGAWERGREEPMLDVSLFANLRFSAASAAVAISFFALSGFIFLVVQYFQFVKNWGPLETGVRLLPVAVSVAASSIIGSKVAVRVGTKTVVAVGLVLSTIFYIWVAQASAGTPYYVIAIQMLILGTGMGLASAPATEAIMGVVPAAKAGVGSAVNDATRLMGGTLGVAIIGSVYTSAFASKLSAGVDIPVPATAVHAAHASVGAAFAAAHQLAASHLIPASHVLAQAATSAFFDGFHTADYVAAGVAGCGALMAFALLPAHPTPEATGPAEAAEPLSSPLQAASA